MELPVNGVEMPSFMRRGTTTLAILATLLVIGCGSGGADAGQNTVRGVEPANPVEPSGPQEVVPAESILASGPETSELTSNSASIVAITEIALACRVEFGTNTDYGRSATDTDMDAGGHQNHGPLLLGLQPGTLYHYRLVGTGPDGTLYESRDYTFRTLPASEAESPGDRGPNLALEASGARVIGVSSSYPGGAQWAAENAIDGDPSTEWSSRGDGDDAWIEIELAKESAIGSVGFWTRTMGASAEISEFRVVTEDGRRLGPFQLDGPQSAQRFPVDVTARRLRFEAVESSGGNTGAVEIEVYGMGQ